MSPEGTIACDELWKRFRSDRKRSPLMHEVSRAKARISKAEVPPRWRWALRHIDFSVEPGESLALVGANGSGKSTLLKILNHVMYPYSGSVQSTGRVGVLIEVTAGIHPQLTGRENIYLYGSLLGLPRKTVADRFDEIVAFADLDQAVDRLVKFYSSGMKMRLGFAVAAFLEPDILLVDEVLAVGDATFQANCLNRMREVLETGATLVFVSHDLAAVEATCNRGIWLDDGVQRIDAPIEECLGAYRGHVEEQAETLPVLEGPVNVTKVEVRSATAAGPVTQGELEIVLRLNSDGPRDIRLYVGVSEGTATPIFSLQQHVELQEGDSLATCLIDHLPLPRGRYFVWVSVFRKGEGQLLRWHPVAKFDVHGANLDPAPRGIVRPSPVHVQSTWQTEHL